MSTGTEDLLYKSTTTKRYDVPLSHLDFGYIRNCSDVKELEKILKELRSGEEGCYPDLERCCEEKLISLNPKSRVLRKDNPVARAGDLPTGDWQKIDKDLKDWTSDMKNVEENLKFTPAEINGDDGLPPIRSGNININGTGNKESDKDSQPKKDKRVQPRDYKEWDKFDIDKELEKADEEESSKPSSQNSVTSGTLDDAIDASGLSDDEKLLKATREKDKGNEAFTSKDFEEAILYYSRSISLIPTAASYNNRALAYLKVSKWNLAVEDCDKVLSMEPRNIKALLRRGSAYKGQKEFQNGQQDFEKVLELEPANRRAEELLAALKKDVGKVVQEKKDRKEKGRRMVIEEVDEVEEPESAVEAEHGRSEECPENVTAVVSNSKENVTEKESDQNKTADTNKDIWDEGEITVAPEGEREQQKVPVTQSRENACNDDSVGTDIEITQNKKNKITEAEISDNIDRETDGSKTESDVQTPSGLTDETGEDSSAIDLSSVNVKLVDKPEQISESSSSESDSEQEQPSLETLTSQPVKRPVFVQLPLPGEVGKLREEGNNLFRAGQYGEALSKYAMAIQKLEAEKDDHRVSLSLLYSNRAACNLKIGHCVDAIKDCTKSLELVPHSIKPLVRRASAYEIIENFKLAYIDNKHALSLDHNVVQANQAAHRCHSILHQLHGHKWRHDLPALVRVSPWDVPEIFDVDGKSLNPSLTNTLPTSTELPGITPTQSPSNVSTTPSNVSTTPSNVSTTHSNVSSSTTPTPSNIPSEQAEPSTILKEEAATKTRKPVTSEEKFEAFKSEGNEFVKQGDFRGAISRYTRCMEIFPSKAVSYTNRALCHLRVNQPLDAVNDCNLALEMEKGNVKALFRRGQARKMMKRYKESLEDLTQLLKLDPKNAAAKKELELVKSYWREELNTMKSHMPSKAGKGSPTKQHHPMATPSKTEQKQRKRMVIEEDDDEEDIEPRVSQKGKPSRSKDPAPSKASNATTNMKPPDEHKHASHKKGKSASKNTVPQSASPAPSPAAPKLEKLTPYEFLQAWNSLKTAKDVKPYANLLHQIPPAELPSMITSKLDGDMLNKITTCVADHFVPSGEYDSSYLILDNLSKVQRFNTVSMFMSSKERKGNNGERG